MTLRLLSGLSAAIALAVGSPALAVCSEATLSRDFAESDAVVHATVVAETYVIDDEPDAEFRARWGDYSPVTLHRLRVIETFKGHAGPTINFFDEVSSGRFGLDIGKEYLLFLYYYRSEPGLGTAARGAMRVKHTCGPSSEWQTVPTSDLIQLRILAKAEKH